MKRFRAAQAAQATLEQYSIVTTITVPVMVTVAEGLLTLKATVTVLGYKEGTDWQTEPLWTRRAKAGECSVSLWSRPDPAYIYGTLIGTANTNASGEVTISATCPDGSVSIDVIHLASNATFVKQFDVLNGVVDVASLRDLGVTNYGSPMPVTFEQARMGQPAAQAYPNRPRVQWTGRGWSV